MAGRQLHRANPPSESPIEFYRRSVVIPFTDEVLEQMRTRFSSEFRDPVSALLNLVPVIIMNAPRLSISQLIEKLHIYDKDLPNISSLPGEIEIWRNR